jgi:hypothetical protein
MSGTPSQSQNQRKNTGIWLGPTVGKSSPKNSRRACLCLDGKRYSRKCCDGFLINQGIGQTQSPSVELGSFSDGFSSGFDI